jgi:hypothetical protein
MAGENGAEPSGGEALNQSETVVRSKFRTEVVRFFEGGNV